MSYCEVQSSIGSTMVTNAELAKKVQEQDDKNLEFKAKIDALKIMLEETTLKIEAMTNKVTQQEDHDRQNQQVSDEEEAPTPDPKIAKEPFLREIMTLNQKAWKTILRVKM